MCSSNAAKTAQAAICGVDRTDILELRSDGVGGVLGGAHPLQLPRGIPLAVIVHPLAGQTPGLPDPYSATD